MLANEAMTRAQTIRPATLHCPTRFSDELNNLQRGAFAGTKRRWLYSRRASTSARVKPWMLNKRLHLFWYNLSHYTRKLLPPGILWFDKFLFFSKQPIKLKIRGDPWSVDYPLTFQVATMNRVDFLCMEQIHEWFQKERPSLKIIILLFMPSKKMLQISSSLKFN